MKCYNCGAEVAEEMRFCTACGKKMKIDSELIEAAKKGDDAAISELYLRSYNSVYYNIKLMIKDEETVLDVLQDSYIKAFRNLQSLEKPEYFTAWTKRIAVNTAKDCLKKKKPMLFTELEDDDGNMPEFVDSKIEIQPEEKADFNESKRLLWEIIDSLSDEQRIAVTLFYFEEMSVKDIAAQLECSENTVKSRLNYARKKIEQKVLELEKKGTKLYGLAPLPLLVFLFRFIQSQPATVLPAPLLAALASSVAASAPTAVSAAGNTVASAAVKTGTVTAAKAISVKLVAAIAAGVVAVGGIGIGIGIAVSNSSKASEQVVSEYSQAVEYLPSEAEESSEVVESSAASSVSAGPTVQDYLGTYTSEDTDITITIAEAADGNPQVTMAVGEAEGSEEDIYTTKLENGVIVMHFTGDRYQTERQHTLSLSGNTLTVLGDDYYEARSAHPISGVYTKVNPSSSTTEGGNEIDSLNGRFIKGQQTVIINVQNSDYAHVTLMDDRNGGVTTFIDGDGTFSNGVLTVPVEYYKPNVGETTETVSISIMEVGSISFDASEDFQYACNSNLAGVYTRDENSSGTSANAGSSLIDRLYAEYSNGSITITMERTGDNTFTAVIDGVRYAYTEVEEEPGALICHLGNTVHTWYMSSDETLAFSSQGSEPEWEGVYYPVGNYYLR